MVWILESCVNIWQRRKRPLGEREWYLLYFPHGSYRVLELRFVYLDMLLPCQGAWGWGKRQKDRDAQNQARRHVGFANPSSNLAFHRPNSNYCGKVPEEGMTM